MLTLNTLPLIVEGVKHLWSYGPKQISYNNRKKSGLPFTKYSNNPHVVIDLALSSLLSTAAHPAQQVRRSVVVANTINLALHLRKVYAVDFPC